MTFDLTDDEVQLLREVLDREIEDRTNELVRTDARDMQHALNRDVERITSLRNRLDVTPAHRVAPPSSARH